MSKRAAVYARISDVKKSSDREKVPAQIAACKGLAEREGYDVVAVFAEADGTSATTGAPRPQFEALLSLIEAGEVDVVLATETERLIRDELDGLRLRVACAEVDAVWHMVRGGITEVASASGDLMAGFKALIGRYESRNKADRQKQKYGELRHQGLPHPGPRIFGWKQGRMEAEPVEAEMVRAGSMHIIGGGSVYGLVKAWNQSGVKTTAGKAWTHQGVRQVLTRPKNCGRVVESGKVLDVVGKWDHLVTPEVFDAVVATFEGRSGSYVPEPRWISTGIARCGVCGAAMGTTKANGRLYARCSAVKAGRGDGQRHVGIALEPLEAEVRRAVVDALFLAPPTEDPEALALETLVMELADVQAQIGRLVDAVMTGALSAADVAPRRRELEVTAEGLRVNIAEASTRNAKAALLAELRSSLWSGGKVSLMKAAEVKASVRRRFDELPLEAARALTQSLLSITVMPGRGAERIEIEERAA